MFGFARRCMPPVLQFGAFAPTNIVGARSLLLANTGHTLTAWSSVTSSGTGQPTVTVSGTPTVAGTITIRVTSGGLSTMKFSWWLNGTAMETLVSGTPYTLGTTGAVVTFSAGSYTLGNAYTFSSVTGVWADQLGKFSCAAVTAPNNAADSSWTAFGLSSRTATRITASATNGAHCIVGTPTGYNYGRTAHYSVDVLGGNRQYAFLSASSYLPGSVFLDRSTGTLPYQNGVSNAVVTSLSGGGHRVEFDCIPTSGEPMQVGMSNASGAITYTDDGSGYLDIANINVTQTIAAATTTASKRATVIYDSFGKLAVSGDGSNTSMACKVAGMSQPRSVLLCGYFSDAWTSGFTDHVFDDATTTDAFSLSRANDTRAVISGGTAANATVASGSTAQPSTMVAVFNGANSALYQNGVLVWSGDAGSSAITGFTLFSSAAGTAFSKFNMYGFETAAGAVTAGTALSWHNWWKAKGYVS